MIIYAEITMVTKPTTAITARIDSPIKPVERPIAANTNENSLIWATVTLVLNEVYSLYPNLEMMMMNIKGFPMITKRASTIDGKIWLDASLSCIWAPRVTKNTAIKKFMRG